MFNWIKHFTHRQKLSEESHPEKPILHVMHKLCIYLIDAVHAHPAKKRALAECDILKKYQLEYPRHIINAELHKFFMWILADRRRMEPSASSTGGLIDDSGELIEVGEFLAGFIESEMTLKRYLYRDGNRLFYRDSINEKNNPSGELIEVGEFLGKFIENEPALNQYFCRDGGRLFYRDSIKTYERIQISDFVRENYFQRVRIY